MLDLSNGAVSASAGALLLLIDGDGVDGGVVSNGDDGESGEGVHCYGSLGGRFRWLGRLRTWSLPISRPSLIYATFFCPRSGHGRGVRFMTNCEYDCGRLALTQCLLPCGNKNAGGTKVDPRELDHRHSTTTTWISPSCSAHSPFNRLENF